MILEKIKSDYETALRARDTLQVGVSRLLISEINNKEIQLRGEGKVLTEADVLGVISKEIKKRKEAADIYASAGRPELAKEETDEMGVISKYLPAQMGEEEIKEAVQNIINSNEKADFSTVMKAAMVELKGKADGKLVSQIIKDSLK